MGFTFRGMELKFFARKPLSSDGRVVRACATGAVDLGLIPSRVKPNDFEIGIHSFSAGRSALKGQCGEQAGKFTC